jgi:hypothetical protein
LCHVDLECDPDVDGIDSLLGWPALARKFRNKFERNNRVAFRNGLALAKQNSGENFASRASTREIYENPFCFIPSRFHMIFCEFRGTSKLKILYYLNPTVAFCPSHNLSYRT